MTTIQPQTRIGDRYIIEQTLNQGQGTLVVRGSDTRLARPVAIKLIAPDQALTYRAALAEAARLGHPAFVGIYDSLEHEGQLAIIQEYIAGQRFADLAAAQLSAFEVARIGQELALALAHAHRLGVIHGDLTPAAVLRDRWGAIRINNVALPADAAYFATAGNILDTGDWMPIAPTFVDDLRAMGVLLWLLLANRAAPPEAPTGWEACPMVPPAPLRDIIERLTIPAHPQAIAAAESAVSALRVALRQLAPAPPPLAKTPPWELARDTALSPAITPDQVRRLGVWPSSDAPREPGGDGEQAGRSPGPRPYRMFRAPAVNGRGAVSSRPARAAHAPAVDPGPSDSRIAEGPLAPHAADREPTWGDPQPAMRPSTPRTPTSSMGLPRPRSRQRLLNAALWVAICIALFLFWLVIGYLVPGWLGH